ncbi:short chain dehydrogenase domain-containing protein [Trichoderma breve]|uniref:Short chain dehydrogenase domain-containing protein n=1 Tax=Trichoderma breve TaxID=2034170 RepID=A0A9W9BBJ5_9HYPO|nr:short chain dehydrogenase domain-containing protein [Trichoderma breve]KAJ4859457.1 short chain dehydrogenase domain-containing protein [Trichoderma breve]
MALSVAGRYAIITGGGSGINLAFAKKLLSRGCSVLVGDISLRPEAQELLKQYPHDPLTPPSANRPVALFKKTDVTSWPQLSALTQAAETAFPQIDIVVPGAGIFEPSPSQDDADGDPGHYAVIDVNLTHPIRLSQLAIAHWTSRRIPGSLLIVGSMAGYVHGIGSPLYFASKHGVHGFVRSLGRLRDTVGIRTAAIAPGAVNTPLWSDDPDKSSMISADEITASAEDVADAMLELLENPQFGDGTIFEATARGTRVVPAFNAPPPDIEDGGISEYEAGVARQWEKKITEEGLKV